MNADEAQKCLLVARRLLAQAEAGPVSDANATLERALRYAEKGLRLDPDTVGAATDELVARIRSVARTVGSGGSGGSGSASGAGARQRTAPTSATRTAPRAAAAPVKEEVVKGTPEQEMLMAKMRRTTDYYEILGVTREASDDEIKKGYRKMSLKLHPDKCKASGAEEAFKTINKAFACLSDPDKKAAYNRYGTEDPSSLSRGGGGGAVGVGELPSPGQWSRTFSLPGPVTLEVEGGPRTHYKMLHAQSRLLEMFFWKEKAGAKVVRSSMGLDSGFG